MRSFDALTAIGRARRLRALAETVAIDRFGLTEPRVRLLSQHSFNTMFRVDCDGSRFVLRVGDACRIHADGVEEVEAEWLNRLGASSTITAPRAIAATDGKWRVDVECNSVSGRRACSLFTFIEGRELRSTTVGPPEIHEAGALLARLHEDAASASVLTPVPGQLHADRVVYFHKENLVRDYEAENGAMFSEAVDRVQSVIDGLWRSPPHTPHVLHGDFGTHNVLTWRKHLRPIDFQDLQFGFDVQDLGLSIADLGRNTPELVEPFTAGYATVRPLPELPPDLLAALSAGRSLNMMNLGLHLRRQGIEWFLDRHGQLVADWMSETT